MIRVIIERRVKEGCLQNYLELIRRARKQATAIEGFIAGELLHEKSDPHHAVIISSWNDFASWQDWEASDARKATLADMKVFLETDEKITVLEGSQLGK